MAQRLDADPAKWPGQVDRDERGAP